MILRGYQEEAIAKLQYFSNHKGNDLCVLPTGAGKSLVIAELAHRIGKPILILQPTREILEQNVQKMLQYVSESEIGVYSASVNRKDISTYTFAMIQSIYKKPKDFEHFEIVIIDECHLLNPKNKYGMFNKFLEDIGQPKVIGLTATPYRLDTKWTKENGYLESVTTIKLINRVAGFFWNRLVYNINIGDLIEQGYLCPLEYIDQSFIRHYDIPKNKSESDFNLDKFVEMAQEYSPQIVKAITYAVESSKSVLVFCATVDHAEFLAQATGGVCVSANTKAKDRVKIVEEFKSGKIKLVFNVGVFTTGFDHPSLDCIVLLRPTRSIALYYQMLGRGVRKAGGKTRCRVIDLTSNVRSIGRLETIKLQKEGLWELVSEKGKWHNKELYRFEVDS